MVKYRDRRRVEKVVDVLSCVATAVAMCALFWAWVILMACM